MLKPIVHDCNECTLAERIGSSSLIAFDLDNTLACSRKPMLDPMAEALSNLINVIPVAIVTGGCLSLVQSQVLDKLLPGTQLTRLHIMPTNGTSYYRVRDDASLQCVYEHRIKSEQAEHIIAVIKECALRMGLWKEPGDSMLWGEQIENRGSQITFSALGQLAPISYKKAWDPAGSLQTRLQECVAQALPDFSVRAGGNTSIDVCCRGDDKAHALRMLAQYCGFSVENITFIGDRMYPGGNDYPTAFTGALAVKVGNPEDTLALCLEVLAYLQ